MINFYAVDLADPVFIVMHGVTSGLLALDAWVRGVR